MDKKEARRRARSSKILIFVIIIEAISMLVVDFYPPASKWLWFRYSVPGSVGITVTVFGALVLWNLHKLHPKKKPKDLD